jgi:hypothetical protein
MPPLLRIVSCPIESPKMESALPHSTQATEGKRPVAPWNWLPFLVGCGSAALLLIPSIRPDILVFGYLDWVAQVGVAIALLYFLIQLMARLFEQRWRGALFAFLRILGLVVFAFLTLCAAAFLTWRWNLIHL